jgi:heat shock protein HslJ
MLKREKIISALLIAIFSIQISANNITVENLDDINGNWHLRVMDGKEVRKARAILDFHAEKMILNGFDSCNRISGTLKTDNNNTFSSTLMTTRMACRQSIHSYVSKRLHETISEGFTITENRRYGVDGITLKSKRHDLFFKKMGD